MRELTSTETEYAAGGGVVTAFALGVAGSLAAAYAYEKMGGAEGIEKAIKSAWKALTDGAKDRAKQCGTSPAACLG